MRRTGLHRLVEATIASSSLGMSKPDSRAFALGLARFGVSPVHALYVGDRLDVDARAATNAGLTGVWLSRSGQPPAAGSSLSRALPTCRRSGRAEVPTVLTRPRALDPALSLACFRSDA